MEKDAVMEPLIPDLTKHALKVLAWFLFYSFLMFTLPFAAFFGTKYLLREFLNVSGYTNTVYSVIASVITVNLIIVAYAYHAYHEKEYDNDGNEIDQQYPTRADLNLKQD